MAANAETKQQKWTDQLYRTFANKERFERSLFVAFATRSLCGYQSKWLSCLSVCGAKPLCLYVFVFCIEVALAHMTYK